MPGLQAVLVALDGDSIVGNNAAIALVALASMVLGYLVLAGLWYFVFRRSPADREAERVADEARAEAVRQWRPATAAHPAEDPAAPAAERGAHPSPLRIERTAGPRFRRR